MTEQTFQTKARNEYIYSNFLKKKKKKQKKNDFLTKEKRFLNLPAHLT